MTAPAVTDRWHEGDWHTRVWVESPIALAYEVREVCGADGEKPLFRRKGSVGKDYTAIVEEGHIHIHGTIKWDGCSHSYFPLDPDIVEPGYLHSCGRGHLVALGAVFGHLYDEAIRLLGEGYREYLA